MLSSEQWRDVWAVAHCIDPGLGDVWHELHRQFMGPVPFSDELLCLWRAIVIERQVAIKLGSHSLLLPQLKSEASRF